MKILLAIDGSAGSDSAIRKVIAQFRPDETEVRVVHADEWPKGLPTSIAFAEGPTAADDLLAARADARRKGTEMLAYAAGQLEAARFHVKSELREGGAEQAILESAGEWRPDLIVVGSHGRTGFNRLLMGSVSERVVRNAPCSVQVVRA